MRLLAATRFLLVLAICVAAGAPANAGSPGYDCRLRYHFWDLTNDVGSGVHVSDPFAVAVSDEPTLKVFDIGRGKVTAFVQTVHAYGIRKAPEEFRPYSVRLALRSGEHLGRNWWRLAPDSSEAEVPFAAKWREATVTKYIVLGPDEVATVSLVCTQRK